jgi:opacity protein-like surface antigen
MNNVYRNVLGAGLVLLATGAAAQDVGKGWYFGVGAGGSNYPDSVPPQIAAAYRNNDIYTLNSARTIDNGDTAAQVFAGYRFLPWLAVEVGYQDMGKARTFYQLDPHVQLNYPMPALTGEYGLRDVNAALVGIWPINERFELLARAGVSNTRLEYDEHGFDINAKPYSFHARTRTRSGAIAGIGAAWNFSSHLALRLDLDRNFDIGKTFALNVQGNGHFDHVDLYTANLVWRQ